MSFSVFSSFSADANSDSTERMVFSSLMAVDRSGEGGETLAMLATNSRRLLADARQEEGVRRCSGRAGEEAGFAEEVERV
jgi:hypothetical protein